MVNSRLSISRLMWILAAAVIISACGSSLPDNSAENANSLSIVISNPLEDITVSTGEEVAITSTSFSGLGVDHVELLVNGQVVAISTSLDSGSEMYVALLSWFPSSPGSYQVSVVVEDVDGDRVESDLLTVTVEEQAEAPTATSPPPAPTNAPLPTNTQVLVSTQAPTATIEPSPTSSGSFTPIPIIVSPIPIIFTPAPTSGFIFNPIPIIISLGPPSVQFELKVQVIPPNSAMSVEAQCPEGSVVTGGGYNSSNPHGVNVIWSVKNWPDEWVVAAENTTNSELTLRVTAICLSNSGGSTAMVEKIETIQVDEQKSVSAACPAGSVVTGGGWAKASGPSIPVRQSFQSGNGWTVQFGNYTNSPTQVRAYAICLSGTDAASYQYMESAYVGAGNYGDATAFCEHGQLISGGGFYTGGVTIFKNDPIGPNASEPKYGWSVQGKNQAHHTTFSIQSFATCLDFP